jgi:hypothetical protein
MHHVFLAPVLSIDCTRTAYPKLTFVNVPPVPHETASIYSQSLVEPHRPGRTSSEHDDIAAAARPAESLAPRRTQITRHPDPSTVAEGSSADLSWSISHSHLQPPAPSPIHVPSKRQKRQHEAEPAQAPISTRMTRRGKLLEPSEESINIGPTPSIMRDHLAASQEARPATRETDEVTRLPDHFVKASELVRRAIGPRRSSRLRLSGESDTPTKASLCACVSQDTDSGRGKHNHGYRLARLARLSEHHHHPHSPLSILRPGLAYMDDPPLAPLHFAEHPVPSGWHECTLGQGIRHCMRRFDRTGGTASAQGRKDAGSGRELVDIQLESCRSPDGGEWECKRKGCWGRGVVSCEIVE